MAPTWSLTVATTTVVLMMIYQDPVISYGAVSQHVHKISGASNINVNSTHDSLAAAPSDKSAYWNPQLYYLHSNGQFEEVPNGGMAVYYLGRGMDAAGGTLAGPFPKGLKFLSGNNDARSYDANTMTYGNETYPSVPIANRVTFACVDYNNPRPETHYISDTNCPNGMRAQITFQSCWDGVNLIDNGICPPSYPILLPVLFIEVPYAVVDIIQDGGKFVFANGDETGYGFHGDFINGWDIPTLTSSMSECLLANEDGLNFLNTPPLPYPGNDQYKSLGCYTEPTDARALTGNSYSSTTDMTAKAYIGYIGFCAGSIYAAVEYASECYCGSDLNFRSVPAPPADCAITCSGDLWEVCGGSRRINLYQRK
ncbi:hypothetical protein V502_07371 [Pseudogymnoascus sp. VKM F-4520 (FW-2644)]|nr:hypothetical protein V502_07371 [Pseudogymnoascus sp. VKM F-4520 (FW-2644)]